MQAISIALAQDEVDQAKRLLGSYGAEGAFTFSATRFLPDLGAVTEVVRVVGPVHGEYPRENGNWVKSLGEDLACGLYTLD